MPPRRLKSVISSSKAPKGSARRSLWKRVVGPQGRPMKIIGRDGKRHTVYRKIGPNGAEKKTAIRKRVVKADGSIKYRYVAITKRTVSKAPRKPKTPFGLKRVLSSRLTAFPKGYDVVADLEKGAAVHSETIGRQPRNKRGVNIAGSGDTFAVKYYPKKGKVIKGRL